MYRFADGALFIEAEATFDDSDTDRGAIVGGTGAVRERARDGRRPTRRTTSCTCCPRSERIGAMVTERAHRRAGARPPAPRGPRRRCGPPPAPSRCTAAAIVVALGSDEAEPYELLAMLALGLAIATCAALGALVVAGQPGHRLGLALLGGGALGSVWTLATA